MDITPQVGGLAFIRRPAFAEETAFVGLIILVGVVESFVLGRHHVSADGWRSIFNAGFGFGELVQSLREHGEYRVCYGDGHGFWDQFWGHICFSAHRLPFIPLFLAAISFISLNPITVLAIKNVIFFAISALAFVEARRTFTTPWLLVLTCAAIFYLNPINARVAADLDFEEGYIYHLLPWVFLILATPNRKKGKVLVLGLVLFALVLLKSSLFYFCLACVGLTAMLEWRHISLVLPPLLCVCLAIVGWGVFTYHASGKFAFGSDMSSNNGWNLYKGNNPHTAEYYQKSHLDNLDYDGLTKLSGNFNNEWDLNDKYKELAVEFITQNPFQTAENILARLYVVFISPSDIGSHPRWMKQTRDLSLTISVNHLVILLSLIGALIGIIRRTDIRYMAIIYITLLLAYLAPYIVGFAYPRHVVPASGMALFFIMAAWGVMATSHHRGDAPTSPTRTTRG